MILFSGTNIRTLVDEVFWGLSYSVGIDFQKKIWSRLFRTVFFTIYQKSAKCWKYIPMAWALLSDIYY